MSGEVAFEKAGIPTVVLVGEGFWPVAEDVALGNGLLAFPLIRIKHPSTFTNDAALLEEIDSKTDAIVAGLTKPAPKMNLEVAKPKTESVEAPTYAEFYAKVNQLFLERRWVDGLPIVPPTVEAVEKMLTGTSRKRDEVVAMIPPRNGVATVEVIAVNAVMAGCKPQDLPVVIAAVEAATDPKFMLSQIQTTGNPVEPMLLINGPIAKELNINSSQGIFGPSPMHSGGDPIGRALSIIMIGLGGALPDVNATSTFSMLNRFTSGAFAEAEEASPWKPYHVDLGFAPGDSTVTVFPVAGAALREGPVTACDPNVSVDMVLESLAAGMDTGAFGNTIQNSDTVWVISPPGAILLAKAGLSKEDVRQELYKRSFYTVTAQEVCNASKTEGRPVKPGDRLHAVQKAGDIKIVVAGGVNNWGGWNVYFPGTWGGPRAITRKITGATLTKAGR